MTHVKFLYCFKCCKIVFYHVTKMKKTPEMSLRYYGKLLRDSLPCFV